MELENTTLTTRLQRVTDDEAALKKCQLQLTVCEERERAIAEKVSANQATLLANLTGLKDCCEATVL